MTTPTEPIGSIPRPASLIEAVALRDGTDATLDVLNEDALRDQTDLLRITLASIGDAVITTGPDGRITFLNHVAETLTGWTQTEAVGQPAATVLSILDEVTRLPLESPVEKVLRIGGITAVANHTILIAKDGREIPVDDSAAPIRDRFGILRGVVIVFRDITERKWNEQNQRESEERFRAIFNQATAGFAETDLTGKFLMVNDRYCEMVGYSREELLQLRMQDITVKEDLPRNLSQFRQMLATGESFVIEKRYRRKNGSIVWVNNNVSTVLGANGKPKFALAVSLDITERKHEESRFALLARLGEITRTVNDPAELLFAVARAVGENFHVRRCLFNEIDLDKGVETVHRDYTRRVKSVAGKHNIFDYSPVTLADMRAGKTVVNSDSKSDSRTARLYKKTYEPAGERAYVAVPLMRGGRWVASLWVSNDEPRIWSNEEIKLLESIGERAWLAVERLRSETALRESEERFSKAFNSSPLAVTITSLKTRKLVDVNETFVNLTGYTRDEAVGRSTAEIGLWQKPADRDSELESVESHGQIRNVEYRFRMKDGTELVGLLSAELIEIGNEPCALTVIQDITERKLSEEAKARLAAIVESTNDAVISKDLQGTIKTWNEGAKKIFGYSASETVGKSITMLIPSRHNDEEKVILEKIKSCETIDHYETVRRRKDKKEIEVSLTVSPIRDGAGNIIGASKIARDITESKQIETALIKSEERFSRFMHHLPGLAWIKDMEGRYVYANDAAVAAFCTTREKLYGKVDAQVFPREIAARYVENDKKALEVGPVGVQAVETLEHDDGVLHHSIVSKFPIAGPDGQIILIGGMAIDITERQQMEEDLRRYREELETLVVERTIELADVNKKLRAENAQRLRIEREAVRLLKQIVTIQEDERTRIARDLHDDLGQKLTALRLKLENAKEICNEEPVCNEIDATQAIAERIDADIGFLAWELRPVTLTESGLPDTLAAYVKEWGRFSSVKAEFHAKGFEKMRLGSDIEINLYRIVQEGLNNAHKYAKARNVSVLLEKHKYDVSLIIEDDGIGFNPDQKRKRGKGLGLIGMSERAALLGGHLEIETARGAGTTIFVRVPVK